MKIDLSALLWFNGCMKKGIPVVIPLKLSCGFASAFGHISHRKGAFLLDSAQTTGKDCRYSFAGINPLHTFSSTGGFISVDGHTVIDQPRGALQRFVNLAERLGDDPYLPFSGGLVGFISFEWGNTRGNLFPSEHIPDVSFGLYDTVAIYDHLEGLAWVSSLGLKEDGFQDESLASVRAEKLASALQESTLLKMFEGYPPFHGKVSPANSLTKDRFIGAVKTLKQVDNSPLFAPRFSSPIYKTAWQTYLNLRGENPTPFAAFLNCGSFYILSASRTCLLQIEQGMICTHPTKGTIGRSKLAEDDSIRRSELVHDTEKQASHRYLVASMMNAMDHICEPGTIEPIEIASIESDARAHHMVSNIHGEKISRATALDCLLTLMPPATDTSRTASMIGGLEGSARNVYTGTIGFIGGSHAEFNLAFRTLILKDTIGYLHAGTEIGYLTDPEEAFENTGRAAKHIFELCHTKSI